MTTMAHPQRAQIVRSWRGWRDGNPTPPVGDLFPDGVLGELLEQAEQ